jgi:hypothetical protein
MADEQHNKYENMAGLGRFATLSEDRSDLAVAAKGRSIAGREEFSDEERIPSPESAGWSTVERLANLQSFR